MNYGKTILLFGAMTALFLGLGGLIAGEAGLVIALVVALGMNGWAWWNSDKMALRMHNAQPATRASHPRLIAMVEELSQEAGLPTPAVYVIDTDQPNAFATGRAPSSAAVAATTGIMRMLDERELRGVMAHELAHIQNRDTLIMTVAASFASALAMLAQFGQYAMFFNSRDKSPLQIIGMIAGIILAPMAAALVQMTISRTREYAADRRGAEIARDPLGLASALRKISRGIRPMESAERNPATAHLFIVNPLTGQGFDGLFRTHPPADRRIAALEAMADEFRPVTARRSTIPRVRI